MKEPSGRLFGGNCCDLSQAEIIGIELAGALRDRGPGAGVGGVRYLVREVLGAALLRSFPHPTGAGESTRLSKTERSRKQGQMPLLAACSTGESLSDRKFEPVDNKRLITVVRHRLPVWIRLRIIASASAKAARDSCSRLYQVVPGLGTNVPQRNKTSSVSSCQCLLAFGDGALNGAQRNWVALVHQFRLPAGSPSRGDVQLAGRLSADYLRPQAGRLRRVHFLG